MIFFIWGVALAASWMIFGVLALFPTFVCAVMASSGPVDLEKRSPLLIIFFVAMVAGLLLRVVDAIGLLSFVDSWLYWLAQARSFQPQLAQDLISGERGAESNYLMLVASGFIMAAAILFCATRSTMFGTVVTSESEKIFADKTRSRFF